MNVCNQYFMAHLPTALLCASVMSLGACHSTTAECPPVIAHDASPAPFEQQLQQQQLTLETLRASLNEAEHQLQTTQQQLAAKDQQLQTLQQDVNAREVSTQSEAVTRLEQQLAAQQREIGQLQAALYEENKPQ